MLYEAQNDLPKLRLHAVYTCKTADGYNDFQFSLHITLQENKLRQSVFGQPISSWPLFRPAWLNIAFRSPLVELAGAHTRRCTRGHNPYSYMIIKCCPTTSEIKNIKHWVLITRETAECNLVILSNIKCASSRFLLIWHSLKVLIKKVSVWLKRLGRC